MAQTYRFSIRVETVKMGLVEDVLRAVAAELRAKRAAGTLATLLTTPIVVPVRTLDQTVARGTITLVQEDV